MTRRVRHAEQAEQLPVLAVLLDGDAERAVAAGGELGRLLAVVCDELLVELGEAQDGVGRALGGRELLAVAVLDLGRDALRDRVCRRDMRASASPVQYEQGSKAIGGGGERRWR